MKQQVQGMIAVSVTTNKIDILFEMFLDGHTLLLINHILQ